MKLFCLLTFLFFSSLGYSQIYSHNFGTTAISGHPYTVAPGTLDANLSGSSWANSFSSWTSFAGSSGVAISLNSSSTATATITLTFNVASGYEASVESFSFWRQRSSSGYANWSMTINGVAVGNGTTPTSGAGTGTINVSNPVNNQTGTMTVVLTLSTASGTGGTFRLDDFTLNGTVTSTAACVSATQPSSAASALNFTDVGCNSMTINWTNGDATKHLVVVRSGAAVAGSPTDQTPYTANSALGSGSTIAANEYVVYNSTGNSVTVTGLTPGVTYHFKIFAFNGTGCPASGENYLTSTTVSASQATLPSCGCPQITGVMINSCTGTCSEGDNEIIFMNSGSYSIPVSPANIKVYYDVSSPAAVNYTESFTTNATYVSNLNTISGCGTLFYDASAVGTIPPNTEFLVMRSTACYSYDFTSFCGSGPIYILFTTDASWTQSGNFSNSCSPVRHFRTDFTGIGACALNYSFDPCQLTLNADGDAISFPAGGGAADNYFNTGCNPPPTVLPVNLVSFEGKRTGKNVDLAWLTATELNNSHFTVERSVNGRDFVAAGTVSGGGTTNQPKAYSFTDLKVSSEKLYYRLRQTDYDGTSVASSVISIGKAGDKNSLFAVSSGANGTQLNFFDEHSARVITIVDMSGRVIFTRQYDSAGTSIPLPEMFSKGLYFVSVTADGEYASEKFWQQ